MKISFVIPAYNEEHYIADCLETVLKRIEETGVDAEVIVVNNASTDHTREVVSHFKKVQLIDEPEKGLSCARQAGFLASKGELIANIDADTHLPKGWIETVIKSFDNNKKLVALSGPQIFYDVSTWILFYAALFYCLTYLGYILNRFVFRVSSFVQGGNFVIRRTSLEKIGGYNREFRFYGEDADVAYRLNKIGQVKFTFMLPISASGRRIVKEGKFTMGFRYIINYFWTIFFRKPFTTQSLDIRLRTEALFQRPGGKK